MPPPRQTCEFELVGELALDLPPTPLPLFLLFFFFFPPSSSFPSLLPEAANLCLSPLHPVSFPKPQTERKDIRPGST